MISKNKRNATPDFQGTSVSLFLFEFYTHVYEIFEPFSL